MNLELQYPFILDRLLDDNLTETQQVSYQGKEKYSCRDWFFHTSEHKKYTIVTLWKRPLIPSPLCPVCSQTLPTFHGRKILSSRLQKQREIASEFP